MLSLAGNALAGDGTHDSAATSLWAAMDGDLVFLRRETLVRGRERGKEQRKVGEGQRSIAGSAAHRHHRRRPPPSTTPLGVAPLCLRISLREREAGKGIKERRGVRLRSTKPKAQTLTAVGRSPTMGVSNSAAAVAYDCRGAGEAEKNGI
jgi:hypothetical protein